MTKFSVGKPLVSVNIPTYNSGETLEECLRSISDQSYPNVETIIIDSKSQDGTLTIARRHHARIYFADSLSGARLEGIRESKGDYILLVDSDQVVDIDVIAKCVEMCERERFDAVTLFERSIIKENSFVEKVVAYDKWLIHISKDDDVNYGAAIPRFFRAESLKKVRIPPGLVTFDHNLLYATAMRNKSRVGFLDAYIYHHEPSSWSGLARKFLRYGTRYSRAFRVNRKLVAFHSMPRRAYFSKRALRDPSLFVGLLALYCVKAIATIAGAMTSWFEEPDD